VVLLPYRSYQGLRNAWLCHFTALVIHRCHLTGALLARAPYGHGMSRGDKQDSGHGRGPYLASGCRETECCGSMLEWI
jgi:hypothetical protein